MGMSWAGPALHSKSHTANYKSGPFVFKVEEAKQGVSILLTLSEHVKESDRRFQIANREFINAFEIRLYTHPQFVIRAWFKIALFRVTVRPIGVTARTVPVPGRARVSESLGSTWIRGERTA